MVDYTGMRRSLLATFGEPVQVTVGGVTSPLTAAYLAPYQGVDVGGVQVNRPDPQFLVETALWAATGAGAGNTLTRADATVFTVVDARPEDDGLTVVTARRY